MRYVKLIHDRNDYSQTSLCQIADSLHIFPELKSALKAPPSCGGVLRRAPKKGVRLREGQDKRKEKKEATGSVVASRDVPCVVVEEGADGWEVGWSELRCRGRLKEAGFDE